jgi:Tol biopolymer transport system component
VNVAKGTIQTLGAVQARENVTGFLPSNWAPDNDQIVFADEHNGVSNLYWPSRSTSQVQQLTHFDSQSGFVRAGAWSPRGDQIVFERNDMAANIYAADLHF